MRAGGVYKAYQEDQTALADLPHVGALTVSSVNAVVWVTSQMAQHPIRNTFTI